MAKAIDWNSESVEVLTPRLKVEVPEDFPALSGHVWVSSSGTQSVPKWVALSKAGFLESAQSVNDFFAVTDKDVWLRTLPRFHVAGLGIEARAFLASCSVFSLESWSPQEFLDSCSKHAVTLTSLVPTQVFDLRDSTPPKKLRAVLVGGGALSPQLWDHMQQKGWSLFPSYGLTEATGTVAINPSQKPVDQMQLLPHLQAKTQGGVLQLKGKSLFTSILALEGQKWRARSGPTMEEWWTTEDEVELQQGQLCFVRRRGQMIKILGELFDLTEAQSQWLEFCPRPLQSGIAVQPHERKENEVILVAQRQEGLERAVERFNAQIAPYARIEKIYLVQDWPQHPLGKFPQRQIKLLLDSGQFRVLDVK